MIADLCLVLLLDGSSSVDKSEWDLQARATAEALASAEVVSRITSGPHGRIVVTAIEWSHTTVVIVPWTEIAGAADARSFATRMEAYPRQLGGSTAVGGALKAAAAEFMAVPDCQRRAVDISGDGPENNGSDPEGAVALLLALDATVNAIVIDDEVGVLEFYQRTVSGFVLPATWDSYRQAIKAKLTLEIAGIAPGGLPTVRRDYDERDWRTYWWPQPLEFWTIGAQHDGRPDPNCNCHHWTPIVQETPTPDAALLLGSALLLLGAIAWSWRRK